MGCENALKKRMVVLTLVSTDEVLSDWQILIGSSEAPSKAWFQDQEEMAKRHTSSAIPMDDDDFKPIPVVNELPGMLLALFSFIVADPNQFLRNGQR